MKKNSSIKTQMDALLQKTTQTLKSEGKFTPLFEMQAKLVSMLLAKIESILDRMESGNYEIIETETTREGHERTKINPCEKLLLDYTDRAMKALKGLGMNTDSKEVKAETDSLNDFLSEFGGND